MSDTEVKITLSAEDQASPTIQRLVNRVKQLEAQLERNFKSKYGRNTFASKLVTDLAKNTNAFNEAQKGYKDSLNSLTQSRMRWARGLAENMKMSRSGFDDLRRKVRALEAEYDNAAKKMTKNGLVPKWSTKQLHEWRKSYRRAYQDAAAYQTVWNRQTEQRRKLEDQIAQAQYRVMQGQKVLRDKAHKEQLQQIRREERERDRAHQANIRRMQQAARAPFRAASRLTDPYFSSPAFAATATAGAAAYGTRALLTSGTSVDTAQTMSRVHAFDGMPVAESRRLSDELRRQWAIPQGFTLGVGPEAAMNAFTEVMKSGVADPKMAKEVARLGVMAAKSLGLDVAETIEQMGYGIASEFGAGRLKDAEGLHKLINVATTLASRTAANPQQMMSFLRTGLGAGANIGLTSEETLAFGALAVESGAQGQQAARLLSTMGTRLVDLRGKEEAIRRSGNMTREDREFLSAPRMMGYGSWRDVQNQLAQDPTEIFDFLQSFMQIDDIQLRKGVIQEVFGQEFSRFLENMMQRPESFAKVQQIAAEAAGEKSTDSFISRSFSVWMEGLEFLQGQISSAWSSFTSSLGLAFKPFVQDLAKYAALWIPHIDKFTEMFSKGLDGMVDGFLGRDGTFTDLLHAMFGDPSTFVGDSMAVYEFFRSFTAGIRAMWDFLRGMGDVAAGILRAFGVDTDGIKVLASLAGGVMTLAIALQFLKPVLAVLGMLASLVGALGGALKGVPSLVKTAGSGAASGGGGALMGALKGGLRGGIAGVVTALLGERLITGLLKSGTPAFDSMLGITPEQRAAAESQAANPWGNMAQRFGNVFAGRGFVTDEELPKFAHGGSFTVGGAGGTDSKLVKFWATPGERVSVNTPNQAGGGGVLVNLRTAGVEDRLGQMVSALYSISSTQRDFTDRIRVASLGDMGFSSYRSGLAGSTAGLPIPSGGGGMGLPGGGSLGGTPFGPNFYVPNIRPPGAGGSYSTGMPGNSFFDAIIKAEGTARDGNPYNEVLGYGAYGRPSKPLTQMTLNEVKAFGLQMRRAQAARGTPWEKTSSASGAFQIVGTTMMDAAAALGMDPNTTIFNEETQRRMALWIAQKQGLGAWEGFKSHPDQRQIAAAALAAGVNPAASVAGTGGFTLAGVPIKDLQENLGGGDHHLGLTALAQELTAGGVAGNLNRFTAFNDLFHVGRNSMHNKGLATDFTILDPSKSAEAAEQVRNMFRQAGLTDDMFRVIDEYKNPSSGATGGHIHAQFQSAQAAAIYQNYVAQQRALVAQQASQSAQAIAGSAVSPQDAIRNVPTQPSSLMAARLAAASGQSSGPVTINVNGANQSPEEIANLVQRRITETMNWRTHDVEHDLT